MPIETVLQQAERQLREADERIARQEAILAELERKGDPPAVNRARNILTTMYGTRELFREQLDLLRRV
jgi:hypothetical protein